MTDFCDLKGFKKGVATLTACCVALAIVTIMGKEAYASKCYHHYNDSAWHGDGMAIVFCLNSGGYSYPENAEEDGDSLPMKACEVRYRKSGKKIMNFSPHFATDHDRQIFSDYDTLGATFTGNPLDIVCTGKNGKTYTYYIPEPSSWEDPNVCPKWAGYQGEDECVNDHNPILSVSKTGKGTGKITSNVAGDVSGSIYCLSDCKKDVAHYQYYSNKKVRLKATPDPGYAFLGWQGACQGGGYCYVTMNGDKNVVAKFGKAALAPVNSLLMKEDR